jgi:hypothetical protein
LVLEFMRAWWKSGGGGRTMLRSLFGVHGEQALRFHHGLVSRIESRELLARAAG